MPHGSSSSKDRTESPQFSGNISQWAGRPGTGIASPGETDEIGWNVTKDPIHVNDLHATTLNLFGLDHLKLTYRFKGRDFRLTDVGGKVVQQLIS